MLYTMYIICVCVCVDQLVHVRERVCLGVSRGVGVVIELPSLGQIGEWEKYVCSHIAI